MPYDSRPRGVGGWLLLFIIGQLILRPLMVWAEYAQAENVSEISKMFPTTGTLFTVEWVIIIHLLVFGIAVAFTLWKIRTPFAVLLAKIYLVANPVLLLVDALLYTLSDLPPATRDLVVRQGLYSAGRMLVWSIIWFLYFVKSDRVQATYYDNAASRPA